MSRLYFITTNTKIFNIRLNSKTHLVGIPDKKVANKMSVMMHKRGEIGSRVSRVDYLNDDFYEMLKLNQVNIMIATDVKFNRHTFELHGDIIDCPKVSNDELVDHLEKIYVQDGPRY